METVEPPLPRPTSSKDYGYDVSISQVEQWYTLAPEILNAGMIMMEDLPGLNKYKDPTAGNRYLDWINHVSWQRARLSRASTRRCSGQKIGANTEHCNRPKQNPHCGRTIPGMWCSRRERTKSQGPLTEIQCARLAWHSITRQRKPELGRVWLSNSNWQAMVYFGDG